MSEVPIGEIDRQRNGRRREIRRLKQDPRFDGGIKIRLRRKSEKRDRTEKRKTKHERFQILKRF
ncbi:hypothetical protein CCACVL1_24987 [Corchorus capsularis]|uniref:Uncharacterized protein n=1 Tax=Corchorus capsularis TaxID=210143 RepID=A0A1R3GMA4_COCAP|nr:hypothetical protein CCACVL1_24987 [Corchorus capsularis]